MTETTYRVIGFGAAGHGFFNQPRFLLKLSDACEVYNEFLHDPEFDGAVLIRVKHEEWEVILEFGTENTSVVCGPLGNFKVERAPQLVLV